MTNICDFLMTWGNAKNFKYVLIDFYIRLTSAVSYENCPFEFKMLSARLVYWYTHLKLFIELKNLSLYFYSHYFYVSI